jgi:chromosome segregation ATPase
MSLSTTMLDDCLAISSPWANNSNAGNRSKSSHQKQQQRRNLNESSDRTLFLQEELKKVEEERSMLEQQLGRQVKTLEERLDQVRESNTNQQLSLVDKISDLEEARWTAEEKVVHLQHAVTNSSAKAHNMVQSMEAMKLQSDTLRTALALKEQQHTKTEQQAHQKEEHLRYQVTTLASQLRDTKENGASAAKEQELTQQLQHRAAVEASLQQSLQSARMQLTSIQTEQENVLTSLQHALGRDVALVRTTCLLVVGPVITVAAVTL